MGGLQKIIIKTVDGRELDSWSEDYRLYCEAKTVLTKFRTNEQRREFLMRIKDKRGVNGYHYIRAEMIKLHDYFK